MSEFVSLVIEGRPKIAKFLLLASIESEFIILHKSYKLEIPENFKT